MPSNPLRKILDRRRGEGGNPSEEALEKLERGIRESRQAVRRQNEGIARGYFDDSIEALKRGVEESRATLEGLPEQVPGGEEESFRAFVGELTEAYARIEEALDEAAESAPDAEGPEGPEDRETDGHEAEETGPGDEIADGEVCGAAGAAIEEAGEAADEVVGVAEQAVDGAGETQTPRASDAARRMAQDLGVDLSQVEGTGSGGSITVRDVNRLAEAAGESDASGAVEAPDGDVQWDGAVEGDEEGGDDEGEPRATNAARRRAEELGVDLAGIRGTGAGGLITIQDVVKP